MSTAELRGPDAGRAHESYRGLRRFGSLDGLRFLCIGAVLWHHSPLLNAGGFSARILHRGFTGVDFFFVLSGFLITTLLLREAEARGRFSLSGFYRRRALRILPVYYLLVTAIGAYYIWGKGAAEYLGYMPFYYLFLANFLQGDVPLLSPTWSLSVEEQYYLLWPLLLLLLPRRWLLGGLGPLLCTAALGGAFDPLGIRGFDLGLLRINMPPYSAILIGSALAVTLHDPRGFALFWRVLGHRAAPLGTFALLLVLWQVLPGDLSGWPFLVMHLAMAACLASIVLREDHLLAPVLTFPPVARIGMVSYGIYLYHLPAMHFAHLIGENRMWLVMLAYPALSWLVAEISYRFYERHFLAWAHRPPGGGRTA